jgi:hypothetical protein
MTDTPTPGLRLMLPANFFQMIYTNQTDRIFRQLRCLNPEIDSEALLDFMGAKVRRNEGDGKK